MLHNVFKGHASMQNNLFTFLIILSDFLFLYVDNIHHENAFCDDTVKNAISSKPEITR